MILLIDMDAFFASVEQAHHPRLRGKPVIVCGDPSRRGVVTAASYEARPFGVRAGMPLAEARRLCPQAETVEGNPGKYIALSVRLLDLYLTYSPDVEPFSVDEAFVGLAKGVTLDEAEEIAGRIQSAIEERFSLGASIGIGPNKLVAKMASGVRKPRGRTALDEDGFRSVFWPREVQEMWGVGPRLAERMRSLGIQTVGDLARAPESALEAAFGVIGPQLREAAWGRDDTPLVPYHQTVAPKSMGHEVTLTLDSGDPAFLEGTLLRLSDQVTRRLRADGYSGRIVTLKLRNHRFETCTRQQALSSHTDDPQRVFEVARELWRLNWKGGPLRLLGVSVSGLERVATENQCELFDGDRRSRSLIEALDRMRDKFGEASVVPAGALTHEIKLRHVPFGAISTHPGNERRS
ncbi:MAG: DNA polymerase IV [Candidatus Eisenbacteria bacterium]|nr:DNA polymerase IV [Candidatus Eisenbacteria bacterium]